MSIYNVLCKECIKVPLESNTKSGIFKELIELLYNNGKIEDIEGTLADIEKREAEGSTALENGIAVPHAKSDSVKELTVAIGISPEGLDCNSIDGKPSHFFFLLLARKDESGPHVRALGDIASLMRDTEFRTKLSECQTPDSIYELIRQEENI